MVFLHVRQAEYLFTLGICFQMLQPDAKEKKKSKENQVLQGGV